MDEYLKMDFDKNNIAYRKTEDIYKRYREIAHNAESLTSFYAELDYDYCIKYMLYIPGYTIAPSSHMLDSTTFNSSEVNVDTRKHACYLSPFLHDHNFYEIIYVAEGSCENTIGDMTIHMEKGDIFFMPPYVTHALDVFSKSIIINILVRKSFMEKIFIADNFKKNTLFDFIYSSLFEQNTNSCVLCHTGKDIFCRNILEFLFAETQKENIDSVGFTLNEKIFNTFLLYIAEHYNENLTVIHSKDSYSIDKILPSILSYIENHFKTVTLSDLSSVFHYSIDHISKLIKSKTGKNFVDLRTEYRMKVACNLLSNTDLPIKRISETIGYNRAEQFNKAFKNLFGVVPSVYRDAASQ